MNLRTLFAGLIFIASTLAAPAQTKTTTDDLNKSLDMLVGDHVKVQRLLADLQQAVAAKDASAVAALVHYPIKVNPGKHPFVVRSEKAFVKDYDQIITPDIAAVIEKQKYEALFVNSQGAMLGSGEVWISSICRDKSCKQSDIKISTIQDAMELKP
jgi:hypothetical protein